MPGSDKTVVIFRKFPDGEIVALFPYIIDAPHRVMTYMHVGQHSNMDYHRVVSLTRPAKPEEYASLARELTRIGYNLDIRARRLFRPIFLVVKNGSMELFFASKSREKADQYYSRNVHVVQMDTWALSQDEFWTEWPDAKLDYDYFRNPRGVKEWRPES